MPTKLPRYRTADSVPAVPTALAPSGFGPRYDELSARLAVEQNPVRIKEIGDEMLRIVNAEMAALRVAHQKLVRK